MYNLFTLNSSQKIKSVARSIRSQNLHDGWFLPGANCSAIKLWLAARERIPLHGAPPLGNYDMAAVGLGSFVSSRGWVELANPASMRLSLRHFNINCCSRRTSIKKSDSDDSEFHDFTELGEFQLALRTMRTAASFIMSWNFSFAALENFLINTKFCKDDLGDCENRAQLLTQFVDYLISENASKWRDAEPFLTTGELKNTWKKNSIGRTWVSRSSRSSMYATIGTRVPALSKPVHASLCAVSRFATHATTVRTHRTSCSSAARITRGWWRIPEPRGKPYQELVLNSSS